MGKKKILHEEPFVSICTPTFNRRPFIPAMIECFNHQTYPKDKMEWIIIDDGTDKIEDLVKEIPNVKYFKYDTKMPLGKKRNLMHTKTKGEIIIYMDDDDYYPPERVSHAVTMLLSHPKALCAGASEIYIYFKHIEKMYQFGPYGPNHATAGTFAFKRQLLKNHSYDDNASLAEERAFLKDYTVPFVQLEPKKTILVFSHRHNTFDKKTLLNNINPKYTKESDKKVEDFIKEKKLASFFVNEIDDALINYKPGEPSMKPDVLEQIKTITAHRNENAQTQSQSQIQGQLCREVNGKQEFLKPEEIATLLTQQDNTIKILQELLKKKDAYIKVLVSKVSKTDEWTLLPNE
jgi:glycosyltransferase involved in cell wall biosynthesis